MMKLRPARVRVPGSTSNLGAGFDCMGLALDVHLAADFEPGGLSLRLERAGTLESLGAGNDDLLMSAFRARLAVHGYDAPAGTLRARSAIPIGRGLGSSAAALVAGAALAESAAGVTPEAIRGAAFAYAAEREGHPDNAAPAVYGGLQAVVRIEGGGAYRPVRLSMSPLLGLAFAAPGASVSTVAARAVLPASVPHVMARRSLARMAALLRGLEGADADLLRTAFADELHVPFRLPLIPGGAAAVAAALAAGAWAVTISGSGSGLFAVCARGAEERIAHEMQSAFEGEGPGSLSFGTAVDEDGLVLLEEPVSA
jgi:homoserine kinase